jgi:prephenate dehydrogenase
VNAGGTQDSVSEPEGRGAAWTEERGTSDEGRRRLKAPRRRAGDTARGTGPRRVVVIGTGLIGTSVALALRERGADVWLADRDAAAARLAANIGAGTLLPLAGQPWEEPAGGPADLAVLAVPPAAVAPALAEAQARNLARWYTDVASVKSFPLAAARARGCDLSSFVPAHPLSGRERSGPAAARADLFLGRPWVICPAAENSEAAVAAVVDLARACGAEPVLASAAEHDRWVALTSHAPHVVSAAMAARLADSSDSALALAGQGLRDVTRIAAGDTALWTQILAANAAPVAEILAAVAADLAAAAEALAEAVPIGQPAAVSPARLGRGPAGPDQGSAGPDQGSAGPDQGSAGPDWGPAGLAEPGAAPRFRGNARGNVSAETPAEPAGRADPAALKVLAALLDQGCAGVARIPGKQGSPARADAVVQVVIRDLPGELARLFEAAGQAGVNIEDIGIEHSPGLPVGVAELTVRPGAVAPLTEALAAHGWPVRG